MSRVLFILALTLLAASAFGQSDVNMWQDTQNHLWVETDFYRWDITHGSSFVLKIGDEPREWRPEGYREYRLSLGRGGGSNFGYRFMNDLSLEEFGTTGNEGYAVLQGAFNTDGTPEPISIRLTFYRSTPLIKWDFFVDNVTATPNPPALALRLSMLSGGDVTSSDFYHYSGQSGAAAFPYMSWRMFSAPQLATVGSTDFIYLTQYDTAVHQGYAAILNKNDATNFISDINYGFGTVNDAHYYAAYSILSLHPNATIHTSYYWYFYETDPFVPYQPVDDFISQKLGVNTLPVFVDIKPGACPNPLNIKATGRTDIDSGRETGDSFAAKDDAGVVRFNGVLPVAILGTAEFDVTSIDPASITLAGVSPERSAFEDVATPVETDAGECACNDAGPDGFVDLTLKFSRRDIIAAIGDAYDGDVVPLIMTGQLADGTPFEGSDCVTIVGSGGPNLAQGDDFDLGNYPNPFNPSTEISFSLPAAGHARLTIYNVMGQQVIELVNGSLEAGAHTVTWSGRNQDGASVASGLYFYRLESGAATATKKMMLLK